MGWSCSWDTVNNFWPSSLSHSIPGLMASWLREYGSGSLWRNLIPSVRLASDSRVGGHYIRGGGGQQMCLSIFSFLISGIHSNQVFAKNNWVNINLQALMGGGGHICAFPSFLLCGIHSNHGFAKNNWSWVKNSLKALKGRWYDGFATYFLDPFSSLSTAPPLSLQTLSSSLLSVDRRPSSRRD